LHEPQCKNPDEPDSSTSDYELWSPNDGRSGSKCLMGHVLTFVRKKRENECYNGEKFERELFVEDCVCTAHDYECDLNYYRDTKSNVCAQVEGELLTFDTCEDSDTYEIPTGYRRVSGNTCIGGVSSELDPLVLDCSSTSFSAVLYYTGLLAIISGFCYFIYTQTDLIKSYVLKVVSRTRSEYRYGDLSRVPESAEDELYDRQPLTGDSDD
jgi:hypothetical protein